MTEPRQKLQNEAPKYKTPVANPLVLTVGPREVSVTTPAVTKELPRPKTTFKDLLQTVQVQSLEFNTSNIPYSSSPPGADRLPNGQLSPEKPPFAGTPLPGTGSIFLPGTIPFSRTVLPGTTPPVGGTLPNLTATIPQLPGSVPLPGSTLPQGIQAKSQSPDKGGSPQHILPMPGTQLERQHSSVSSLGSPQSVGSITNIGAMYQQFPYGSPGKSPTGSPSSLGIVPLVALEEEVIKYDLLEGIEDSGFVPKNKHDRFTAEMNEEWEINVYKELQSLGEEYVNAALANLIASGFEADLQSFQQNVSSVVRALKDGWVFHAPYYPNFNEHYTRNGKKIPFVELSEQTLKTIALRLRVISRASFDKVSQLEILNMYKKHVNKVFYESVQTLTVSQLITASRFFRIPLVLRGRDLRLQSSDTVSPELVRKYMELQNRSLGRELYEENMFFKAYRLDFSPAKKDSIKYSDKLSMKLPPFEYEKMSIYSIKSKLFSYGQRKVSFFGKTLVLKPKGYGQDVDTSREVTAREVARYINNKSNIVDSKTNKEIHLSTVLYLLPESEVPKLMDLFELTGLQGTFDDLVQLLCLCFYTETDPKIFKEFVQINQDELISAIPISLMQELRINPIMFFDRISTLWTIVTWTECPIPLVTQTSRYRSLSSIESRTISGLAKILYDQPTVDPCTHLRYCSKMRKTRIESLVITSHYKNVVPFIRSTNLITFPKGVASMRDMFTYYKNNIKYYKRYASRKHKPSFPTGKYAKDRDHVLKVMEAYSDKEILELFCFQEFIWSDRDSFIKEIVDLIVSSEDTWLPLSKKENALNPSMDPISLEERVYDDPDNPVVAFGRAFAYRAYQLSELNESFKMTREKNAKGRMVTKVEFYNPLYGSIFEEVQDAFVRGGEKDTLKMFSIMDIMKLDELLNKLYAGASPQLITNIDSLKVKIQEGISASEEVLAYFRERSAIYRRFTPQQRDSIIQFYLRMFSLSMYARFWSGAPNDFVYTFVENGSDEYHRYGAVEIPQGFEHCYVGVGQRAVNYTENSLLLNQTFNQNPGLPDKIGDVVPIDRAVFDFIHETFNLNYDWTSGAIDLSNVKFLDIFCDSTKAQMCLADLSDRGLKTSFVYLTTVLGLSEGDFNAALKKMFGTDDLPDFKPQDMSGTRHIDPGLRGMR